MDGALLPAADPRRDIRIRKNPKRTATQDHSAARIPLPHLLFIPIFSPISRRTRPTAAAKFFRRNFPNEEFFSIFFRATTLWGEACLFVAPHYVNAATIICHRKTGLH